jgi:large subunit ribosomal protein L5
MSIQKGLEKIIVNMGVGRFKDDKKYLESAADDLAIITGQRPATRVARKAIAGFKLRAGDPVGLVVTLRGKRADDFFKKLVCIVLPRLRDFHGVPRKAFDGSGNYTLGIEEHTVFSEIDPNKVDKIKGLEITIVTTAKTDEEGLQLLEDLGMPFEKITQ